MQPRAVAKSIAGSAAAIEVRSSGPFSTGVCLWRDETGRLLATVVAKATYRLTPGRSEMIEVPDPIRPHDEYWDDGAAQSLRFPTDLVPAKVTHDVVVVGHAHASGDRPTEAVTARIVVGEVEKMLEATVPRRSDRAGEVRVGLAQTRFSLRYELGAAGPDNPVGMDPSELTATGGHLLPQLTPVNFRVRPGDYVPAVGLGPVSGAWPLRDSLLRPEDREWLLDKVARPRPRGLDLRFFSIAPGDQRSTVPFRADERLILEGLHPAHARLVTNLAGPPPALRSVSATTALPPFSADTLFIDTDRQIATLAFRTTVPLLEEKLVLEIIPEGSGAAPSTATPDDAMGADATTELDRGAVASAVRAVGEGTSELDRSAFGEAASTGLPFPSASDQSRTCVQSNDDGALPFRRSGSGSSPSRPPPSQPRLAEPPLVTAPPIHVPREAPGAPAPVFGLSRMVPPISDRRPPEPTGGSDAPASPVLSDPFRKAFGLGAEPPKPMHDAPPAPATRNIADAARALDGLKSVAKAASDAAATSMPRTAATRSAIERPAGGRRAIVDLLALDRGVPERLRRSKTHAPLLAVASAPKTHKQVDAAVAEQPRDDRDRLDTLRVLSSGQPLGAEEIDAAFEALLDDATDFEIPLFLVEGEVRPTMDEMETLRVAVEIAKPLAASNKRVQAVVAQASEALSRSVPPLPEVALALCKQLEASTSELSLPSRHFADLVDRTLLEARSYKRRTLLGAPRIRAELSLGRIAVPIYLPEESAAHLPLLPVFSMTALVELRPREDASEPHPTALVAFALGRVLRARK